MFEVTVVVMVLAIFSLFAFGAHMAEKTVAAKAQVQRETNVSAAVLKGKTKKK